MDECKYKEIRCPFCNKIITESSLTYDFGTSKEKSTNRILCQRCKRMVYYTVRIKNYNGPLIKT